MYFYFHSCSTYLTTAGIITAQCKMFIKISFVDVSSPLLTIYMSSLATQIFDLFRVYYKSSLCKINYSALCLKSKAIVEGCIIRQWCKDKNFIQMYFRFFCTAGCSEKSPRSHLENVIHYGIVPQSAKTASS